LRIEDEDRKSVIPVKAEIHLRYDVRDVREELLVISCLEEKELFSPSQIPIWEVLFRYLIMGILKLHSQVQLGNE